MVIVLESSLLFDFSETWFDVFVKLIISWIDWKISEIVIRWLIPILIVILFAIMLYSHWLLRRLVASLFSHHLVLLAKNIGLLHQVMIVGANLLLLSWDCIFSHGIYLFFKIGDALEKWLRLDLSKLGWKVLKDLLIGMDPEPHIPNGIGYVLGANLP